ncbi:MAG: phytoene desaturase family protein [Planctomycetota bacterium]
MVEQRRSNDPHVVVVGGGLAGLAATVELASHGARVTLVEANHHLGGKMNVLEAEGFTFDMGPTIITLPQVLRGILERAGRTPSDEIELVRLDPQWRCFYPDGARLDLLEDPARMAAALDAQFPGTDAGAGWRRFVDYSRRMFRLSERVFFFRDLGAVTDLMNDPAGKDPGMLREVLAMRMHSTVGATIGKWVREPHAAQLAEHFLQYVGSSPFLAPAILSLIASAQIDQGCWYPMGGTREVARSLARLAEQSENVEIVLGERVASLRTEPANGSAARVTGVELAGGRLIEADAVVSNCDIQRTHTDLLGTSEAHAEQKSVRKKYEPACSGLVLYLGLDRQYDHLAHHNFVFSGSSHREFADIYTKGEPAADPTIYLAAPSRTDPGQAPAGGEALYALIHTPYLRPHHEWHGDGGILERYRPVVIEKLKTVGGMPDLEDHIVVEKHLTPNMIDHMYNAEGGAIYGLASHGRFKGGFKPRNRSRLYSNLYFAGGSTNPGPGVPMVLMSGVTAARAACEDAGVTLVGEPEAAEPERTHLEPLAV